MTLGRFVSLSHRRRGVQALPDRPIRWRLRVAALVSAVALVVPLALIVGAGPASAAAAYPVTATVSVGGTPTGVAVDSSTNTVYVANRADNTLSVINGSTDTVTATVSVGGTPTGVAVNPTTHTVYVANQADNTVSVIDGTTNTITATVPVSLAPTAVAVNETTNTVYVATEVVVNAGVGASDGVLSVINGATNTVDAEVTVGRNPAGVAVDESTNTVYVTSPDDNTVTVVDGKTNSVTPSVAFVTGPAGVAVDSSRHAVYVANNYALTNTVSMIDGTTNIATDRVPVGNSPYWVAVDPSTDNVYVTNNIDSTVSVIDEVTNTVVATVPVGARPTAVAVNTTTHAVYVANSEANTVSVISPAAATVPSAPVMIGAGSTASGQAYVMFSPPTDDGGAALTLYTVTATDTTNSAGGGQTASYVPGRNTIVVTGLTDGDAYTFTVTAKNRVGTGPVSAPSNPVTPGAAAKTVPGAPTGVVATAGAGQASVAFVAPSSDGGYPIRGYRVTATDTTTGAGQPLSGNGSPITVTGLTNGHSYTFTVAATNVLGYGQESDASNAVTPAAGGVKPGAPTIGTAMAGDGQATVTFSAPGNVGDSAITGYRVTATDATNPANGGQWASWGSSPITVTGLTNGDEYTFTVAATNASGYGQESDASNAVTPATGGVKPGAPTGVSATAGDGRATVTFTAPTEDGGSPIGGYRVTATDATDSANGGQWASWDSSPITVTGLTNGDEYTFTVAAINGHGTGPSSDASNAVTPKAAMTVPGAPVNVSATAGDGRATVTFSAPESDGGSPIGGYRVTATDATDSANGGQWASWGSSPITVTGLTNGDSYTFTVAATNGNGYGQESGASNEVTPKAARTVPGPPTIGTATAGDGRATVTFTAPTENGGSPINGYRVTATDSTTPANGEQWASWDSSPITVTGLTNGDSYTFTVAAINGQGTGPESDASNAVTPKAAMTVPGPPVNVSATAGDGRATVTFDPPEDDGGSPINGYRVTATDTTNPANGGQWASWGSSPITVIGLTNGDSYRFTVAAINGQGTGPGSDASNAVTPVGPTAPGAPTIGTATAGDRQATVTFTAPASDGGSAITNFQVVATDTASPGDVGPKMAGLTSPIVVLGLTNGHGYTFTVVAINAYGTSIASEASNYVTPAAPTAPGAPTGVSATAGNGQALVVFTAPSSDGGSPISGYTVTAKDAESGIVRNTATGTGSPITFDGLTNGHSYTFTVTATNAIGIGPASESSAPVTPAAAVIPPVVKAAPVGVAFESAPAAGATSVTVTWSAPNPADGVTGYRVTPIKDGVSQSPTDTAATSLRIDDLVQGARYRFEVAAVYGALGVGPAASTATIVLVAALLGPEENDTPDGHGDVVVQGSSGSIEDTTASAHGTGTLVLTPFIANPAAPPEPASAAMLETFDGANAKYFDVYVAGAGGAGSPDFTTVTVRMCDVTSTDAMFWWNPAAGARGGEWMPVTPTVFDAAAGCLTASLNNTDSSPRISQLTGTMFAVALAVRYVAPGNGGGAAVGGVGIDTGTGPAPAQGRVAGTDRYGTSAAIADQFGTASAVVLANGDDAHGGADALSANYLAGRAHAPIVLTGAAALQASSAMAIAQVLAGVKNATIYIMGGPSSVSDAVAASAKAAAAKVTTGTVTVVRIAGANRFETSAKAAGSFGAVTNSIRSTATGAPARTAILASGLVNADALAAGALSYAWGLPVLLTQAGELSDAVRQAISRQKITQLVVLGGTDRVSQAVIAQAHAAGVTSVRRIAGVDRYDTSAQLYAWAMGQATDSTGAHYGAGATGPAYLANGYSGFPDALAAGPLVGKNRGVLLTTGPSALPAQVGTFLGAHRQQIDSVLGLGGPASVSDAVLAAAKGWFR